MAGDPEPTRTTLLEAWRWYRAARKAGASRIDALDIATSSNPPADLSWFKIFCAPGPLRRVINERVEK